MRRHRRFKPGTSPVKDRCGPSGKARYRSEGAAFEALRDLWRKRDEGLRPRRHERRAYRCPLCAGFHLTSQGTVQ